VPPAGVRSGASSFSHLPLTLLVWATFFAAVLIAGTVGLVRRIQTRRSGTTVFGRPAHDVDAWLARAELAAATTPPPVESPPPAVEAGAGDPASDARPQPDAGPPPASGRGEHD
jgi:hypothetical protein